MITLLSSALLSVLGKADYLLPCPFKYITHLDCPGCGFQRSFIALLHGHIQESFILYPATIPFIFSLSLGISTSFLKLKISERLLKVCYIFTGMVIIANYAFKIWAQQLV